MDEAGMSEADKLAFVEDVLLTWGEEAAREVAERYEVDLQALKLRDLVRKPSPTAPPLFFFTWRWRPVRPPSRTGGLQEIRNTP